MQKTRNVITNNNLARSTRGKFFRLVEVANASYATQQKMSMSTVEPAEQSPSGAVLMEFDPLSTAQEKLDSSLLTSAASGLTGVCDVSLGESAVEGDSVTQKIDSSANVPDGLKLENVAQQSEAPPPNSTVSVGYSTTITTNSNTSPAILGPGFVSPQPATLSSSDSSALPQAVINNTQPSHVSSGSPSRNPQQPRAGSPPRELQQQQPLGTSPSESLSRSKSKKKKKKKQKRSSMSAPGSGGGPALSDETISTQMNEIDAFLQTLKVGGGLASLAGVQIPPPPSVGGGPVVTVSSSTAAQGGVAAPPSSSSSAASLVSKSGTYVCMYVGERRSCTNPSIC